MYFIKTVYFQNSILFLILPSHFMKVIVNSNFITHRNRKKDEKINERMNDIHGPA